MPIQGEHTKLLNNGTQKGDTTDNKALLAIGRWLRKPTSWLILFLTAVTLTSCLMLAFLHWNVVHVGQEKDKQIWFEVNAQLINVVFVIITLALQYTRTLTLIYWIKKDDRLAQHYVWYTEQTRQKVLFIIFLLHLDCLGQYLATTVMWYWHYSERPWIFVGVGTAVSFAAAILGWLLNRIWEKRYLKESAVTSGQIQV